MTIQPSTGQMTTPTPKPRLEPGSSSAPLLNDIILLSDKDVRRLRRLRSKRHHSVSPTRLSRQDVTRDQRIAMVTQYSSSKGLVWAKKDEERKRCNDVDGDLMGFDSIKSPRDRRKNRIRSCSPGSLRRNTNVKNEEQRRRSKDGDDSPGTNSNKSLVTKKIRSKAATNGVASKSDEAIEMHHHGSKSKDRDRSKSKDRDRSKSKSRDRSNNKSRDRSKSNSRDRSKSESRDRSKSKDRDRSKSKSRDRSKSKNRDRSKSKDRDRSKSKNRYQKISKSRIRGKSKSRDHGSVDPKPRLQQHRSLPKESNAIRDRNKDRTSNRSKSRSRSRSKSHNLNDDDNKNVVSQVSTFLSTARKRGARPRQRESCNVDDETTCYGNANDDDNGSVSPTQTAESQKSPASATSTISRRGRRPCSSRLLKVKTTEIPHHDSSFSSIESLPTSPETNTDKLKKPSLREHLSSYSPLGAHPRAGKNNEKDALSMVEERSTESSFLGGSETQSILLQFDPTKENLVHTVNQTTAKKTSETIHQLNGSASTLEISELDGLPTFEKSHSSSDFNESASNNTASTQSIFSSDAGPFMDDGNHNKQTSFPLVRGKKSMSLNSLLGVTQKSGESVLERSNASWNSTLRPVTPPRQRGGLGNNLQAKKSTFFKRVKKSKADVKDRFMKNTTISRAGIRLGHVAHTHQALEDDANNSIGDL